MARSYKRDKNGQFASTGGRSASGGAGRGSEKIAAAMQKKNPSVARGVAGRKVQRMETSAVSRLKRPTSESRVAATIGRESMVMRKRDTPAQTRANVAAAGARAVARRSGSSTPKTNSWAAEQQAGRARADAAKAKAEKTGKRVNVDSKTAYDPKLGWVNRRPKR